MKSNAGLNSPPIMARLLGTPQKYRDRINASAEHGAYLTDAIKRHNMSADERSRGNHAKLPADHPLHYPGYPAPGGAKPDGAGGRGEGRSDYGAAIVSGGRVRKSYQDRIDGRTTLMPAGLPQSNHSPSVRNGNNVKG